MKHKVSLLRIPYARLLPALVLLVLLALFLAGCETDTPQNTFDAKGEVAEKQRDIFYLAMWPALVIGIFVIVGLAVTLLRFRRRDPNELPKQVHGNTTLEVAWTIAPAVLLLALGIPMVDTLFDVGRDPSPDAYRINVIGQRFSWEFQYPEITDDEGVPLSTFNEAHIPVDREVAFHLTSIDVIHSFWIPKLGGKLDVVPGEENVLWLIANEAESYSGQCVELCGAEHSNMKMTVIAQPEDEFDAWAEEMAAGGG